MSEFLFTNTGSKHCQGLMDVFLKLGCFLQRSLCQRNNNRKVAFAPLCSSHFKWQKWQAFFEPGCGAASRSVPHREREVRLAPPIKHALLPVSWGRWSNYRLADFSPAGEEARIWPNRPVEGFSWRSAARSARKHLLFFLKPKITRGSTAELKWWV